MANSKRWPIGLQSSTTGDPQGIGQVINELTQQNIAFFSASTDSFSILTDLQNAREASPEVPHTGNIALTGFVDGYHLQVPEYGKPPSVELAKRHWNKVEQRMPIHDPPRSPIKWNNPCIWISTWNEVRPYVGWSQQGQPQPEDPVVGYEGNADLIGWQACEIGREAVRRGYRWAAFGFAGGDPEEGFWDAPGVLAYLRLCQDFPDQLGVALHEYSHELTILNRPDKIGRFQQLHDACDRHGIRRPVIQIKEFGWRDVKIPDDLDEAIGQLKIVADMYMDHPNIHGAAIWTVQKWQGSGIDQQVRDLIPRLRDAALSSAKEIPELSLPPASDNDDPPPAEDPAIQPGAAEWPFSILNASAADAQNRLQATTDEFGIDVSLHQADRLNWSQLKEDGVRFAFIRVGSGKTVQDRNYNRNVFGCLKNDIPFGNYYYLYEDVDIKQQARMFVHQADWRSTLPPVVDIEQHNLTAEQIKTFMTEFHRLVDAPPLMIYTRASLWNHIVPRQENWPSRHPLWVAHWGTDTPALPHHWDRWVFFQPGTKSGLPGYPRSLPGDPIILDYNHFNGPIDELTQSTAQVRVRAAAFTDYLPFDSPVGNAEQRRRKEPMYPGGWIDVNPFGKHYTNPSTGKESFHTGSDLNKNEPHFDADRGAPVRAAADGLVTFAGRLDVWGGVVVVRHGPSLYSRYGHVANIGVEKGQAVERGQKIAEVGQDAFGGPFHLHFDISPTDVLDAQPWHWPGANRELLLRHYVDPRDYIGRHRPYETDDPSSPRLPVPDRFGVVTAVDGLNMRSEPSTAQGETTVIAKLKSGTRIGLYKLVDGWYHARFVDQAGFVFAEFIREEATADEDQGLQPHTLETGMNINPDALHSNPATTGQLEGMNWVRLVFKVDDRREPETGDLEKAFAQYDPIVQAYADQGIKTLFILNQETRQPRNIHEDWRAPQHWTRYCRHFADTAGQIAAHYKEFGDSVAYQIWNEGDKSYKPGQTEVEHVPSVFLFPSAMAELLKEGAAAIRANGPEAKIVFNGMATGPEDSINYWQECKSALNGPWPVDALAVHPYLRIGTMEGAPFDWGEKGLFLKVALRLYRDAFPNMPIWITEVGVAVDDKDKEAVSTDHAYREIAKYMKDLYRHVSKHHATQVHALIWFAWSDNMRNAGMVRSDGSEKPHLFDAFKQVRARTIL